MARGKERNDLKGGFIIGCRSFRHKECSAGCVLINILIRTVTKLMSAINSTGKTINRFGNCGWMCIINSCDVYILVLCVREKQKSYCCFMTEIANSRHNYTVSKNSTSTITCWFSHMQAVSFPTSEELEVKTFWLNYEMNCLLKEQGQGKANS